VRLFYLVFLFILPSLVFAAPTMSPGTIDTAATIQSVGIVWQIDGDDDHDATGTMQYRKLGSKTWRDAMSLVRIDWKSYNHLAGSLFFLDPDSTYEIALTIVDPDGGGQSQTVAVTTRPLPHKPVGGAELHVQPGSGGGTGSINNPYLGLEAAWAVAQPGDTLLLHAGSYGAVRDDSANSGTPGQRIVIRAAGDGPVIFDELALFRASHIWFEGLTFKSVGSELGFYSVVPNAGYDNGFQSMPNEVTDIVVKDNSFTGYKYTLLAGPRTYRWYIADNVIVGPQTLGMEGQASWDSEGIELAHGNDHVVAHNSITLTADAISFPNNNCDIYGNDIFDVTDDGIELDGGEPNTRVWGNRIHNPGHNGFSFQPMDSGPWYIFRNQLVNYQESAFKFVENDRFVLLHNTIVNWNDALDWRGTGMLHGVSRNNLFISLNGSIWPDGNSAPDWRADLNYDGFDWNRGSGGGFQVNGTTYTDISNLVSSTGLQSQGVEFERSTCFENFNVPGPAPLNTIPPQWMTLTQTCKVVDAGQVLPSINDGFSGSAPDLGAYEHGAILPHYGPRLSGIKPDAPIDLQLQ